MGKPKGVLYFDSICREQRGENERVVGSCQPKPIRHQTKPAAETKKTKLEITSYGMVWERERIYHSRYMVDGDSPGTIHYFIGSRYRNCMLESRATWQVQAPITNVDCVAC